MSDLLNILTAPASRHPFLFFRKVRQKVFGSPPCEFTSFAGAKVSYETLKPLAGALAAWSEKIEGPIRTLGWNEIFLQSFDESFLLERCRHGPLKDEPSLKGDIKLPWEFSRGYSYIVNALLCRTEEDKERCSDETARCIALWLRHNSDPNGVNWTCAMEVAIRAFNWICADAVLEGRIAKKLGLDFFTSWLWNHGRIIWDRLEYTLFRVSNHYTANLLGLAALGQVFSGTRDGKKWMRFAQREMQASITLHQTGSDGGLNECSLRYHSLVTEMCLHFYALTGTSVSKGFRNCLRKMCQICADYRDESSGDVFAFGDDDGGRIVPLDFMCDSGRSELLVMYAEQLLSRSFKPAGQAANAISGWAVIRSSGFEIAAEFGPVSGGHAHNDALSISLNYNGCPILVDSGSGLYTSNLELRDRLRGITQHSTIQLDGKSQGIPGYGCSGIFNMKGPQKSCQVDVRERRMTLLNKNPAVGIRARHKRMLEIDPSPRSVLIHDEVFGAKKEIIWHFVFHPLVRVKVSSNGFLLETEMGQWLLTCSSNMNIRILQGLYASFYGQFQETQIGLASMGPKCSEDLVVIDWRLLRAL